MDNIRQLNDLEKAALLYKFYNGVKSFEPAFILSHPERAQRVTANSLKTLVSAWKRSPEVQNYLQDLNLTDKARAARITGQRNTTSNRTTDNETRRDETGKEEKGIFPDDFTNFQNVQEFLNYCTNQANRLTDEKERQFYLKMISDLMQYKETDKGQNDIQRFYTPLQCSNCPLYKEGEKKLQ